MTNIINYSFQNKNNTIIQFFSRSSLNNSNKRSSIFFVYSKKICQNHFSELSLGLYYYDSSEIDTIDKYLAKLYLPIPSTFLFTYFLSFLRDQASFETSINYDI